MAIILAKKNNQFNIQRRHFYIDDESDLVTLEAEWDCGIGDLAEMPNGAIFCRHSDGYDGDLWEQKISGGGKISGSVVVVTQGDDGKMTKSVAELAQVAYSGAMVVYMDHYSGITYILTGAEPDAVFFQTFGNQDPEGRVLTLTGLDPHGEDDVWVGGSYVGMLPYPSDSIRYRTMVGKKTRGVPYHEIVVPEQTVIISEESPSGSVELQNAFSPYFKAGARVVLTMNGEQYSTDVVKDDDVLVAEFDGASAAIWYTYELGESASWFFGSDPGEYTIKLIAIVYPDAYTWSAAYPYDAVIRLSKPTVDPGNNNTATLVQGDFDTLVDAIKDHPLHIGVFGYGTNYSRATTFMVAGATLSTGGPGQQATDPEILINVIQFGGLFDAYVATSEGGSPTQKAEAFMDMTRHAVLYIAKDAETGNTIVDWK